MHPDLNSPTPNASGSGLEPVGSGDRFEAALGARLRELPRQLRPPWDFSALQVRAAARHHRHPPLALAAAVLLALVGVAALLSHGRLSHRAPGPGAAPPVAARASQGHAGRESATHGLPASELPAVPVPGTPGDADAEPLVHVSTRLAVADLEDRIASLDDLLNAAQLTREPEPQLHTLRVRRQELMSSLVQVRYAEHLAAELPQ